MTSCYTTFFMAMKSKGWIGIKTAVLLAVFIGFTWTLTLDSSILSLSPASAPSFTNAPVISDISCDTMEHFKMHIHAHLNIFINGEAYPVPSNIGIIPNQCIYWMHTHDDTGVIHIESPEDRNFTIGEFFDIWGQTFDNSQIFDNIAGENINNALNVYINGKKVNAGTDFRQIPINAHDKITIVYGIPPDPIPSRYAFPEGL
ncbi:MAG TPA: hypothetical protein VE573_13525 [Nitrososphaeraceae archaeon]|nr:hypothetical protein [Nitrososphaeraceae archaeon]